jgi:hypothetical protein
MIDISRLRTRLNATKLQKDNNALYQLLDELILGVEQVRDSVVNTPSEAPTIYDIDTSTTAPSLDLDLYVRNLTIIKDVSGNAAANNITLVGTVDGVVDPTISTDYGSIRLIRNSKTGEYHKV